MIRLDHGPECMTIPVVPPMHPPAILVVILGLLGGTLAIAAEPPAKPLFELRPGERYFRADGTPAFIVGRNPTGTSVVAMDVHFANMEAAGERFARIHFTYSPPEERAGGIAPSMLHSLDGILDAAARHNVAVMPVLDVWANWNDGSNHELWHNWDKNPSNTSRGGPAKSPDELFSDTACRKLWLERVGKFVGHCAPRRQIVAWEFFSELDLVTGATEAKAVEFAKLAAAAIRSADPMGRPITASLSGAHEWPALLASDSLQFVQVHPYTGGGVKGDLDELILRSVHAHLTRYNKAVLIGECGLDWRPPRPPDSLDLLPRASIGIRHAIWAGVVSGAMTGRMLWWHDGYDAYEKADLARDYQLAAAPAAQFVQGIDFTAMTPLVCDISAGLRGAMLGNSRTILGWFRDAACGVPDWPTHPLDGQQVTVAVSGGSWEATLVDAATGKTIETRDVTPAQGQIHLSLPPFEDSIAVKLALRK